MTATTFLSRNPVTGRLEEILGLSNSDAFGRSRVSMPETLFDLSHLNDKQPLYVEELLQTGATTTHLPNESAVRMDVTATVGSRAVRQTKRYFKYQPGKSLLVLLTGVLTNISNTSIRTRIGFFDDHNDKTVDVGGNGIFFQYSGGVVSIVKRSYISGAQVDTVVDQGSWNQGDQLNGLGASGITLDPTKAQIFWMDLEWLGVGSVRCGIIVDGKIVHLHSFHHANLITSVYMTRASLPVRYEIQRMAIGSAGYMKQICATVISEGGFKDTGRTFSKAMTTPVIVGTTSNPLISLKLRDAYNRGSLKIRYADLMSTSNTSLIYQVVYGATLTGASWQNQDLNNSGVQYDTSATSLSGGRVIESGFMTSQNRQVQIDVFNSFDSPNTSIAGIPETVSLVVQTVGGNSNTYGSLTWQESY